MRRLVAAAVGVVLLAAGAQAQGPCYGGRIVIGTIGGFTTMLPPLASDAGSHEVAGLCYNGLLKYDKDLNLVGDLARSWEVSPDGLTITFHLRRGVRFSDGHPYTSADALFTWRFMTDPRTPTPYSGDYLKVARAEAPDPYTFVVHYSEPFAPGLASWTLAQLPRHLLEGTDPRTSPLNRRPVGTGAYILTSWESGSRVVLRYNPDYFEGRAYIDQVIYRVIPDMATMFLELKAGGVDWTGLTPVQYRRQTSTEFFRTNFRKYRYLASSYTFLGYNMRDRRLRDKRVRQAISYAIDKQEIIKGVLLGLGRVATGPYKPDTFWYNPRVRRYRYDPARARALLEAAGWKDTDADGVLDKDGRPFVLHILTNQGNSSRINAGVIIQYRLGKIGIKVKLRTVEWAAFVREFIDKGRFEAVILGWTIPQDPDLYDVWHSSRIGEGKLNFTAYRNARLDELLVAGRRVFDRAKRKEIYDEIQQILAEEQPYTFLYYPEALPIVHARFRGIHPAPAGIAYNFIRWYVPRALQRPALVR